jgi:hypothetical protein
MVALVKLLQLLRASSLVILRRWFRMALAFSFRDGMEEHSGWSKKGQMVSAIKLQDQIFHGLGCSVIAVYRLGVGMCWWWF